MNQPGEICISCQMKQSVPDYLKPQEPKPDYLGNGNNPQIRPKNNTGALDPYPVGGNTAEQKEKKSSGGTYSGIVQNLMTNPVHGSFIERWFNALLHGIPYSSASNQYVFSLFSQDAYSGAGVGGHSVMYYGNVEYSFLTNNTPVIGHGKKMHDGVILANKIEGSNYGFTMKSRFSLSAMAVRLITLLVVALLVLSVVALAGGISGGSRRYDRSTSVENTQTDNGAAADSGRGGTLATTNNPRMQMAGIVLLLIGGFCLIKRTPVSKKIAIIICFIGAGLIYPLLMGLLILFVVIRLFLKIK